MYIIIEIHRHARDKESRVSMHIGGKTRSPYVAGIARAKDPEALKGKLARPPRKRKLCIAKRQSSRTTRTANIIAP